MITEIELKRLFEGLAKVVPSNRSLYLNKINEALDHIDIEDIQEISLQTKIKTYQQMKGDTYHAQSYAGKGSYMHNMRKEREENMKNKIIAKHGDEGKRSLKTAKQDVKKYHDWVDGVKKGKKVGAAPPRPYKR